jgi:hypothetical protein
MSTTAAKKADRATRKFEKTGGKFFQLRHEKRQAKLVASASAATVTNSGGNRPSNNNCAAFRVNSKTTKKAQKFAAADGTRQPCKFWDGTRCSRKELTGHCPVERFHFGTGSGGVGVALEQWGQLTNNR